MNKEIILLVMVVFSFIIMFITFNKLNNKNISKAKRFTYTYWTILIPILGFILVSRLKDKQEQI